MNATTSHNNDLQRPLTTIQANAVASILTQSTNDAISRCKATGRNLKLKFYKGIYTSLHIVFTLNIAISTFQLANT